MQIPPIKRIRYKSRTNEFHLYCIGDIHAGTVACAEDLIKAKIKEIANDPFALWVGMGDYGEFITPHDPRWDIGVIAPWVEQTNVAESQRKWIKKLFEPVTDKCLGLLCGNHETSIRLHNNQDVHLDLCRDLGVENLGFSCFYRLIFNLGNKAFTVDCHFEHGSGAAQTEGGKTMRLAKAMMAFDADIVAMGHLHDVKINQIPTLRLSEGMTIKQRVKVGAITGSWFKAYMQGAYPTYAEIKGYSPTNLGCPIFTIQPAHEYLEVSAGS